MTTLSSSIVKQQIASMRDVEEALARQVLYGGDLATNLLELAKVSEDKLTRLLAESHGLRAAPIGELPAATEPVRRLVPGDLALRHGIYPLAEHDGSLEIAVSEPLPPEIEEDLSFSLGVRIAQRVAPLVRIRQALARDYGLPLDQRSGRVLARIEGRAEFHPSSIPAGGLGDEPSFPRPPSLPPIGYPDLPIDAEALARARAQAELERARAVLPKQQAAMTTARSETLESAPAARPSAASESPARAAPGPGVAVASATSAPARSRPPPGTGRPLSVAPSPRALADLARSDSHPSRSRPRRLGPYTAAMAEQDLLSAGSRDDVLRAFFDFAAQYFDYAALFAVHGDLAEGRDAHGPGADRTRVSGIGVPLDLPSSLAAVRDAGTWQLVKLSHEGIDGTLLKDLRRDPATVALLMPIIVRRRCVLILYGDHGRGDVQLGSVGEVIAFAPLVAAGLERLIMRRKLAARGALGQDQSISSLPGFVLPASVRLPRAPRPTFEERAAALAHALDLPESDESEPLNLATPPPPQAASAAPSPYAATRPAAAPPAAPPLKTPLIPPPAVPAAHSAPAAPAPPKPLDQPPAASSTIPAPAPAPATARPAERAPAPARARAPGPSAPSAKPAAPSAAPAAQARAPAKPAAPSRPPAFPTSGLARPVISIGGPPRHRTPPHGTPIPLSTDASNEGVPIPLTRRSSPNLRGPEEAASDEGWDVLATAGAAAFGPRDPAAPEVTALTKHKPVSPERSVPPAAAAHTASGSPGTASSSPPQSASRSPRRDAPRLELVSEPAPNSAPEIAIGSSEVDEDMEEALRRDGEAPLGVSSRSVAHGAHVPRAPRSSEELKLPTVIVDVESDVRELTTKLVAGDPDAADRLASLGPAAVSALVGLFPGPITSELRRGTTEGPARASECGPILRLLARIGPKAAPFLIVRTNDGDSKVRAWATRLLGEMPTLESARAIARRVSDVNIEVRRATLAAGRMLQADPEVRAVLRSELFEAAVATSTSKESRLAAVEALAEFRDPESVPRLIRLLSERDPALAKSAHWALVTIARQDFARDAVRWTAWWEQNARLHRIEWLIDALLNEDAEIRRAAGDELKALTKEYFGYYDDLPRKERARAQQRYRDWWESRGKARFR